MRASYRSDLASITLDEGSNQSWVQALKPGRYNHPFFGEIVIDSPRAKRFADNANAQVRGIAMDVDYDHKARRDDAAGWVIQTEARTDGVWYLVDWTPEAADKIRNKQYRYFSAEFADEWTNAETGVTHQDVLFGGGLTNRPFIKGMVPVNLSESEAVQARLAETDPAPTGDGGATEGGAVDLTAIRTALKLSEGTSDQDTIAAVLTKLTEPVKPVEPPVQDDLTQLAETHPALAKVLAEQAESKMRLAEMETAMRLAEVRTALHEVDADTTVAITPAVKGLAEPLLHKLPAKERGELLAVLRQFAEGTGTVKLGETGSTDPAKHGTGSDPEKDFLALVDSIQKNDKLSYKDAVRVASQRDRQLFDEYHQATTNFRMVTGG